MTADSADPSRVAKGRSGAGSRLEWRRRRLGHRHTEPGFTLVEMVVALSVIAFLLMPAAQLFYAGASSDSENRAYGDAVALADGDLAQAEAINYSDLGFYVQQVQPSYNCNNYSSASPSSLPGAYETQAAVALGCSVPSGFESVLQPVQTPLRVGDVQFTLNTYVVWATGSGTCSGQSGVTCPNGVPTDAYKQIYAVVTWTLGTNHESTTQSVLVYPGGLGSYAGPNQQGAGVSSSAPASLTGLSVPCSTASPSTCSYNQLQITWTDPGSPEPGWYEIEMATNASYLPTASQADQTSTAWDPSNVTVVGSATAPASSYLVTGLSPSTTYYFEVVAFSQDGSQWTSSNQTSGATTSAPVQACALSSLAVSQSGGAAETITVKKSGTGAGHLLSALSIVATYSGNCTSQDTVKVSATGAQALGPYSLTYSSSTSQFIYNPPSGLCPGGSTTFATGQYVFTATLDSSTTTTANVAITSSGGSASC